MRGPLWTSTEDQVLLDNPTMTALELSRHINRGPTSISNRKVALRKRGAILPPPSHEGRKRKAPQYVGRRILLASTCKECGVLRDAKWFIRNEEGFYSFVCRVCRNSNNSRVGKIRTDDSKSQTRRSQKSLQERTLDLANRSGDPWTEADFQTLSDPDLTIIQKALLLRRTYAATSVKAGLQGYKSRIGLGDPDRNEWIINTPISSELGETS